jgi:anti-sigma regulatory factor (Ser/Thr protein kinase)
MAIPSVPEELRVVRQRLRDWLAVRGYAVRDAEAVILAVNEAAANAIEHGYRDRSGMVELTGEADADVVVVTVVDRGSWREAAPDPARGRGLSLMRTLMDDVVVRPSPTGTTVVLRHALEGDRPARTPLVEAGDQR